VRRLNRWIIATNIRQARRELQELERELSSKPPLGEIELQIGLEHAYHHLNVAWNARSASNRRYANLSNRDFNRWSRFPAIMKPYAVSGRSPWMRRKSKSSKKHLKLRKEYERAQSEAANSKNTEA